MISISILTVGLLTSAGLSSSSQPASAVEPVIVVARATETAPPGTKRLKGGKTLIGAKRDEIEAIVKSSAEAAGKANIYVGETPQHRVDIDDFCLGINELTIEQYAPFLAATGHRPPIDFAGDSRLEAIKAFNEEQRIAREEAKLSGQSYERQRFNADGWWEANWQDVTWSVPQKLAGNPVVNVTFDDVSAYCRWAGVRPMTEFEYQRAARGTSGELYPWGNDWDAKKASCGATGRAEPFQVGSFPTGSRDGIHDLCGNVWEWTSSPYVPYPKYKPLEVKIKKTKSRPGRTVTGLALFDASWYVTAGGSVGNNETVLRASIRQGIVRYQSAGQIGFRIASTAVPGRDLANDIWANGVTQSFLSDNEILTLSPAILQQWTSEPGTVKLDGYAIITGYQSVMFAPVAKLKSISTAADFKRVTPENGPVTLGMLQTDIAIVEPALEPGTYFVGYRSGGNFEAPEEDEDEVEQEDGADAADEEGDVQFWTTPGFDAAVDQLFFFDSKGVPVLAVEANAPGKERLKAGVSSSLHYSAFVPPKRVKKGDPEPVVLDNLDLKMLLAPRSGRTGLTFALRMKIAPNQVDKSW